jgi:excinuclease ABC subunit B
MVKIEIELQEQIAFFKKENKLVEAQRIESRTKYDMEMLKEMGYCNGIENYSRHLSNRRQGEPPFTLLDYFPEEFLTIVDESHVTLPQVRGMYEGDRSRKQTLVNFGFRLPSALDNRPLYFQEFESKIDKVLFVSATPSEFELQKSQGMAEQIIRPTGLVDPVIEVRPTNGQIDNLILEVQKRAGKNERTLITTLTKKFAENLTNYLVQADCRVRYLHSEIETIERVEIIRDLRKGVFDCLVGINLLREGLDLPEVSLVAILDADKEGFLRSAKSLIQTSGRAARNINGFVIFYADRITNSMRIAISETNRRREMQVAFNKANGIEPKSIQKNVTDMIKREAAPTPLEQSLELLTKIRSKFREPLKKDKESYLEALKKSMFQLADDFEFEKAVIFRDEIFKLEGKKNSNKN